MIPGSQRLGILNAVFLSVGDAKADWKLTMVCGWLKTVGGLRKLRHRGIERVDWQLTFAATAYNLVRLRNLGATCP